MYSWSVKELPVPAPACTRTRWPASVRALTALGTQPTRASWSFTSLGTPIIILDSLVTRLSIQARAALRSEAQGNQGDRVQLARPLDVLLMLESLESVNGILSPLAIGFTVEVPLGGESLLDFAVALRSGDLLR